MEKNQKFTVAGRFGDYTPWYFERGWCWSPQGFGKNSSWPVINLDQRLDRRQTGPRNFCKAFSLSRLGTTYAGWLRLGEPVNLCWVSTNAVLFVLQIEGLFFEHEQSDNHSTGR